MNLMELLNELDYIKKRVDNLEAVFNSGKSTVDGTLSELKSINKYLDELERKLEE